MSRFKVPHVACDKCGVVVEGRSIPDGWYEDVVWSPKDEYEDESGHGWQDRVTHTAHDHKFVWVQGHLCDECVSAAESYYVGQFGEREDVCCSWCDSDEVIAVLGADYVLEDSKYGVCLECSPFTITQPSTEAVSEV